MVVPVFMIPQLITLNFISVTYAADIGKCMLTKAIP